MAAEAGDEASDEADQGVLQYLAALEARRTTPADFPQPDRLAGDLASAEMMKAPGDEEGLGPTVDEEGLRHQLGGQTPGSEANLERLEEGFVAGAQDYGRRHGMGYQAWVQAGVDPDVLRRAGIHPESE